MQQPGLLSAIAGATAPSGAEDFTLVVDGVIYGLTAYGGLITYWDNLLCGLSRRGVAIDLSLPEDLRATAPTLPAPVQGTAARVFASTYFTEPVTRPDATVLVVHDTIYEDFPEVVSKLDPIPDIVTRKRRCMHSVDVIVVPTQTTADSLRVHYPFLAKPLRVIGEGVSLHFSRAAHAAADRAAMQLLESGGVGRPFLLHVGGRDFYKNFTFLLGSYLRSGLANDFDLVAIGSGATLASSEAKLLAQHSGRGRLLLLGAVHPQVLSALYRLAAVTVSASLGEGFGLTMIEAVACGCPIACSDIPVFRETVGAGIGEFFNPEAPKLCVDAIYSAAAKTSTDRAGDSDTIRSRFDWNETVSQFLRLLADLVDDRAVTNN